MYCEKCGKVTEGNASLCPECAGTKKKGNSKKLLWLIPGVIAVVVIVIAVSALIKPDKPDIMQATMADEASVGGFFDYVLSGEIMGSSSDYEVVQPQKEQTFLIYMVGSDLESDYGAGSADLGEIMGADIDTETSNFVVFTGGSIRWDLNIATDKNSVYYLDESGKFIHIHDRTLNNMGDPNNLAFFLEYGYYSFPADEYNLILWNHGGGTISGYGVDEIANDYLSLAEIKAALEASPFKGSNKLNSVIFNACLMATIETADVFKDHADYLLASEEVVSAAGYNYNSFAEISEEKHTGPEIAEIIFPAAIQYLKDGLEISYNETVEAMVYRTPFACLDLSKVDGVEGAMNDFFKALDKDISDSFSDISRARDAVYAYGSYYDPSNAAIDHVDIVQFAEKFLDDYPEEAQALIDAVDELEVFLQTETDYSHGVSFYFPYDGLSIAEYSLPFYEMLEFAPDYARFMQNFVKMMEGEEPTVWEDSEEQFGGDEEEEEEPVTEAPTDAEEEEPATEAPTEPEEESETEATTEAEEEEPVTEAPTDAEEVEPSTQAPEKPENQGNVVSEIVLELNDSQKDNFLKAERCVYVKNYQGGYYLVSRTSDVELDGNSLVSQAVNYQYVLTDGEKEIELSMTEYSRTEDEILFTAPVKISRSGARNSYDLFTTGIYAYLSIVVNDKYPDGKILGYYRLTDKNLKTLYQLEDDMTMMSVCYGIMEKEYDDYGNLIPLYNSPGKVEFTSEEVIEVNDDLEIIKKPFNGTNPVYMSVVIYDTHNYSFSTSYRKISAKKMG